MLTDWSRSYGRPGVRLFAWVSCTRRSTHLTLQLECAYHAGVPQVFGMLLLMAFNYTETDRAREQWMPPLGCGLLTAGDILLTASLIYFLRHNRTGFTR